MDSVYYSLKNTELDYDVSAECIGDTHVQLRHNYLKHSNSGKIPAGIKKTIRKNFIQSEACSPTTLEVQAKGPSVLWSSEWFQSQFEQYSKILSRSSKHNRHITKTLVQRCLLQHLHND